MFIALNGQLGSGKSEVCKLLEKEQGFEIYSGGRALRESAAELNISILELNERAKKDFAYDYAIDGKLSEYANKNEGKDIVFDARMAWHFVKDAFKIQLLVSPFIAAERVFKNRESAEEKYSTKEEALKELVERRASENERYKMIYSVTMLDYSNYDLIIDTSHLTPLQVYNVISEQVKEFKKGGYKQKVFVSPENVYPTKSCKELMAGRVKFYYDKIQRGEKLDAVTLAVDEDFLFVLTGHNRTAAYIKAGFGIMECIIDYSAKLPSRKKMNKEELSEWEEFGGFKYPYYPEE